MEDWKVVVLRSDAAKISPEAAEELIEKGGGAEKPELPRLWEEDDGN